MTIQATKEKLLNAVSEIDVSKITLNELNVLANVLKTISETQNEPDYLNKVIETMNSYNIAKISDLKE